MNAPRVQVQGLCRFSFPCTGGFKKHHQSLTARRTAMYDPLRLRERMVWFDHVCLPAIRAQNDPDFALHLLVGEDFPEPFRSQLQDMIAPVPQVVAHFRPPGEHRSVCRDLMLGARDPNADVIAEFRLDDDDAVAVNYVATLRRLFPLVDELRGAPGRLAVDHGKGLVIAAKPDAVTVHPLLTHAWAPATSVYLNAGDDASIMDFPHQKIWMRVPFVNLTDQFMFVRGDHGGNDAKTPWASAGKVSMDAAALPELMRRRFNIDLAGFTAAWQAAVAR